MLRSQGAHRRLQVLRPQVLCWCIDPIAHPQGGFQYRACLVQTLGRVRQHQHRRRTRRLAIARELVGRQAPAQIGQGRIDALTEGVVQSIAPCGQRHWQDAQGMRIADILDAHQHAGERAVGIGNGEPSVRLGAPGMCLDPIARRRIQTRQHLGQGRSADGDQGRSVWMSGKFNGVEHGIS